MTNNPQDFPSEERIDIIGSNGGDGLHYDINQRDKSPCCAQFMRVVASESYVICLECKKEYNIDYKTGNLKGER